MASAAGPDVNQCPRPVEQGRGVHVHGDDGVLQPAVRQRALDEVAQPTVALDRLTLAAEHPQTRDATRRPQVVAVEAGPRLPHAAHTVERRVGANTGGVQRAHRAPDHDIGRDARFEKGLQHSDLHGTEVPAPSENEGGSWCGLWKQPDGH